MRDCGTKFVCTERDCDRDGERMVKGEDAGCDAFDFIVFLFPLDGPDEHGAESIYFLNCSDNVGV